MTTDSNNPLPAFAAPTKPKTQARLMISTIHDGIHINYQIPFASLEDAQSLQNTLVTTPSGPFTIDHIGGKTIMLHTQDIVAITVASRLLEDSVRILDAPYEKWVEEQIEQAGSNSNFGIGR